MGNWEPNRPHELLFDCASATLLELGLDPKRLGGQLGITIVLHTWARDTPLCRRQDAYTANRDELLSIVRDGTLPKLTRGAFTAHEFAAMLPAPWKAARQNVSAETSASQ